MLDSHGVLVGAVKRPDDIIIANPESGQRYALPQVAVAALPDQVIERIAMFTASVVVQTMMNAMKDKCAYPDATVSGGVCHITRVAHNKRHDFLEPPPRKQPKPESETSDDAEG